MGYTHIAQFSTDIESVYGTTFPGSWRDQRMIQGTGRIRTPLNKVPDMTVVHRLQDKNHDKAAAKVGSGFSCDLYLTGLAAALSQAGAYSHPQTNIAEILLAGMGGQRGGRGSLVNGGGAGVAQIPVDPADTAQFAAGGGMVVQNQFRRITAIIGNDLFPEQAFSAAPGNAVPVYNCATFYPVAGSIGGDNQSLILRVLGQTATDQWYVRGAVPTWKLRCRLNEPLVMSVDFEAATWETTSGHTLAAGSFTDGGELVGKIGKVLLGIEGGSTLRNVVAHEVVFDPGMRLIREPAWDGVQLTKRYRMGVWQPTVELTVRIFADAYSGLTFEQWWTDAASETAWKTFTWQIGDTPIVGGAGNGGVALECPRMQFSKEPELVNEGEGFKDVKLRLKADEDGATTGFGSTDLASAIYRIHQF